MYTYMVYWGHQTKGAGEMNAVTVWSIVENNKTRYGVGRRPKGAAIIGKFVKLYNPNTGCISEHYSYQPRNHAQQPNGRWLYERMPR